MIILDASVALADVLPDEQSEEARAVIEHMGRHNLVPLVPAHFMIEYANGVLMAKRRKRLQLPQVQESLDAWMMAPLEVDHHGEVDAIFSLADEHGLTMCDACYLELAVRRKLPLATLDNNLMAAAKKEKVGWSNK